MVHLRSLLHEGVSVFNIGGSLAREYSSYRALIPFPSTFEWRICEVPDIVAKGKAMFAQDSHNGLSFTTEIGGKADILLSCGALQYISGELPELLSRFATLPKHVLINRVPMQDQVPTFFTIQNIGSGSTPYRIANRTEFLSSLQALGYQMIDGWFDDRKLRIPFYPQATVDGYGGFYFYRDAQEAD
jgi:putative methyltransferase (TIGR04325 family)